jgi:Tfp pilus assembly protein FimV
MGRIAFVIGTIMYMRAMIWLLLLAPWGAKADSVLVKEALKQLIERQESTITTAAAPTVMDKSSSSPAAKRRTEPLQPNETLDGLIKRTWPGLPSKEIWVRKTFVELNPKAFVQGNPNLLQPGSTMTLPSQEDLRASFAKTHPAIAALFEHGDKHDAEASKMEPNKSTPSRWVRFP